MQITIQFAATSDQSAQGPPPPTVTQNLLVELRDHYFPEVMEDEEDVPLELGELSIHDEATYSSTVQQTPPSTPIADSLMTWDFQGYCILSLTYAFPTVYAWFKFVNSCNLLSFYV